MVSFDRLVQGRRGPEDLWHGQVELLLLTTPCVRQAWGASICSPGLSLAEEGCG